MTTPVLMVDDEPRVLDGLRRSLQGKIAIVTAGSGAEGLERVDDAVAADQPFPVVVSDMMMPGMDGASFLGQVAARSPDSVLMLLSGQADLDSTISAVNTGNLFRFLTKPCPADELMLALNAALRQHQLVVCERDLIEKTLNGAVEALTEVLALTCPAGVGRARRARALVEAVLAQLPVSDIWELRLAAMLGQIGCVAVPEDLLRERAIGTALSPQQEEVYRRHARVARDLLVRIPRLERVAEWVGAQEDPVAHSPAPGPLPGPTVYAAVMAFLAECDRGPTPWAAGARLTSSRMFPARLIDVLVAATENSSSGAATSRTVAAEELRIGMQLCQDVLTRSGMTLVRKGETVTATLVARLANFAATVGLEEPISVLDPG